jgi:hypothetical protein
MIAPCKVKNAGGFGTVEFSDGTILYPGDTFVGFKLAVLTKNPQRVAAVAGRHSSNCQ